MDPVQGIDMLKLLTMEAILKSCNVTRRDQWGAKPPRGRLEFDWGYDSIVVHYTGHDNLLSMGSIQNFDLNHRHWDDISYHYAVSPRRCLHSSYPDHGAGEMDEAHEGGDGFLASQGYPAEALESVEEAFDLMTLLVESPVDRRGGGAAGVGLDLRGRPEVVGDEGA